MKNKVGYSMYSNQEIPYNEVHITIKGNVAGKHSTPVHSTCALLYHITRKMYFSTQSQSCATWILYNFKTDFRIFYIPFMGFLKTKPWRGFRTHIQRRRVPGHTDILMSDCVPTSIPKLRPRIPRCNTKGPYLSQRC